MTPEPHYTLFNTSIGDDPAVVVVNSALRFFEDRPAFPWHLRISVDCKSLGANGMPTSEESDALYRLEDSISEPLQATKNAIFLARITARGERVLLYRVHDPEEANETLQTLITTPSPLREWDYNMAHDLEWDLAKPELTLMEKDPHFN